MSRSAKGFVPRADRVEINREFASVEAFINEYVSNISRSGVFIKSKDPLPVGTKVNLKFTVLMDEIETVEGVGEVVRVSERPRGMGVVFIHLTEHSQGLLGKLLTRREAQKAVAAGVAAAERAAAQKAAARAAARAAADASTPEDGVLSPAAKVTTPMRAVR
ncbi:MAG: PilZ domain-containing protein, partial [Deltaproteobacteria bacterium]|nr:PilZ domain-containing protein [Deltaproteobacteria bacterium]